MTQRTRNAAGVELWKRLGLIALVAVVMLVANAVASYVYVVALLSGPLALVIAILILIVALPAAIVGVSTLLIGKPLVLGAIAVSLLLAGIDGYGFVSGALQPMLGGQDLGLHLALAALCATAFGLSLGPAPFWILAAIAAIAAPVLIAVQPTNAQRSAIAAAASEEREHAEQVDYFLREGAWPVVTDLEGWRNARVHVTGGGARTWVVSDAGSVALVDVGRPVEDGDIDTPIGCGFIGRLGEAAAAGEGAYPDWCVRTGAGWARPDGTGIAFVRGGRFVALNAATAYEIQLLGTAGSPATAAEIGALAGTLRSMTRDEVDAYLLDVYKAGDTPAIDTPGL